MATHANLKHMRQYHQFTTPVYPECEIGNAIRPKSFVLRGNYDRITGLEEMTHFLSRPQSIGRYVIRTA